jgi:hypothetical protein
MMVEFLKRLYGIKKIDWIAGTIIFFLFVTYYSIILLYRVPTDLQPHAKMAYSFAKGEVQLPPNFLYFFLVALGTGFSKQYAIYYISSVLLISMAITAKFFITAYYSKKTCYILLQTNATPYIIAILMLFVFALPGLNYFSANEFYMGQLVPNVWHNSTTICLMPFSVILFFESCKCLFSEKQQSSGNKFYIVLLILINALIKPSFLFALLPGVFLFLFAEFLFLKNLRNVCTKLLPYLAGVILIYIEYYFIYKLDYVGSINGAKLRPGVTISPFVIWRAFSPNFFIAFLTSCLFPLVYLTATKGKVLKSKLVKFAAVNYVMGLLVWILLAEEGVRKSDGNFIWQMVVVSYLLFFTMIMEFTNAVKIKAIAGLKKWVIGGSFFLHFAWGVFYWLKIIIFKGYS